MGGRDAEGFTTMRASDDTSRSDFASLADGVGNLDMNVGECSPELQKEQFEACRPTRLMSLVVSQTMGNGILGQ